MFSQSWVSESDGWMLKLFVTVQLASKLGDTTSINKMTDLFAASCIE